MRNFVEKHEHGVQRALEILPGLTSWNMILFPYWGILVAPAAVAYYVLLFDIYWFFQSVTTAITASMSHIRIQAAKKHDWVSGFKKLPDWQKIQHLIIVPTYKEPIHILQRTFKSLKNQEMPLKQIHVVLGMEAKEDEQAREEKVKLLKKDYGKIFGSFTVTVHTLVAGEITGKSSNERYAAIQAKKEVIVYQKLDPEFVVVTSCDADHTYHPKHFAYLTYKFLTDNDRYYKFWQSAVFFYQNIWELPAITRLQNRMSSIWNLSQLPRTDRLVSSQNYSLSFILLDKVGYWDPDVIPEDYHIFFKSFYKTQGRVEVEPLYLPLMADAPVGDTTWQTFKAQYFQYQRWAWGVSDDPYVIKNYFLTPNVSFWHKTIRLIHLFKEHFMWPVNWFIITLGISVPVLLNPEFARTTLGYTLPGISSLILTISLGFLVVMLFIESKHQPPAPKNYPLWKKLATPLDFVLLPIVGFVLSALPGLDAHTRLLLGKYLSYKVTEKR